MTFILSDSLRQKTTKSACLYVLLKANATHVVNVNVFSVGFDVEYVRCQRPSAKTIVITCVYLNRQYPKFPEAHHN